MGTDDARLGSAVYCDKDGKSSKHLWYVVEVSETQPEAETVSYLLNPEALRQVHEGWGVSLCWWANMCGNGSYMLENMEGDRLYGNIGYYLDATADDLAADANGYFNFTKIDNHSYKITLAGENRALDIENGKSDAGTTVGVWEYGSDVSQAHRHWQLIPLQLSTDPASVDAVTQATVKLATGRNMLTVTAPSESRCNVEVYALNGVCKGNVDFHRIGSCAACIGILCGKSELRRQRDDTHGQSAVGRCEAELKKKWCIIYSAVRNRGYYMTRFDSQHGSSRGF